MGIGEDAEGQKLVRPAAQQPSSKTSSLYEGLIVPPFSAAAKARGISKELFIFNQKSKQTKKERMAFF